MKRTSNFNSKFLIFLLNTAGIGLVSQKYARYINLFRYYLLYAFILLTSTQIALLFRLSTLVEICITLVFINSGLFLNALTLILHLKKKNVINILESITVDFVDVSANLNAGSSSERFKKFFFSFGLPGIITYVFSVSGTVLLFPFSNKTYDDINALFVPSAFPWTVDTLHKYLMTITLQLSCLSILSVPVALNFLFGIYYMIEIRFQYDLLRKSIEHFNKSKEWLSLADTFDSQLENKALKLFHRCIQHHQKILKFSRNFNACYNTIFAVNLFYSVPNLALILLTIVEEKSFTTIMRNVMAFAIIIIYLLLYMSIGQTLQNENERFRHSLFEVQWYNNKSIKFRKTILIVLCSTQQIQSLQASKKYIASNELFYDILKISYSYFNIMNQAFGHK